MSEKNIERNMLRERAPKLKDVTKEEWDEVNPFNREKVAEFLLESTHLSKQSVKQYESALKIFYNWVREHLNNKKLTDIKKKDFMRFQNFLIRHGMSSGGIKLKRSAVSSLNKYLINYYEDEPEFETFRNFVEGTKSPTSNKVYNKVPLSKDELALVYKTLEEDEKWQILCALKFLYASACRRGELVQITKDIINAEPLKDKEGNPTNVYKTNLIRAKGKGEQGEVRSLLVDKDSIQAAKKWLEVRGEDDNPNLFVHKTKDTVERLAPGALNYWFSEIISDIVGRRINVHLIRATRATHVLEDGSDIKVAQKLLSHKDSSTTSGFYDLRNDDDELTNIF